MCSLAAFVCTDVCLCLQLPLQLRFGQSGVCRYRRPTYLTPLDQALCYVSLPPLHPYCCITTIIITCLILVILTQVYPGALVDGRLMAAFQHLVASQGQEPKKAEAAVAARCQQLLAAMSPLPDDLKALAADPWTEQDDRWYYVTAAQHYGVVRHH